MTIPETTPQPVKRWSITKKQVAERNQQYVEAIFEIQRLKFRLTIAILAIPLSALIGAGIGHWL